VAEGRAVIIVPMYEEMEYIYKFLKPKDGRFLSALNRQQRQYRYTYIRSAKRLTIVDFVVLRSPGNLACLSDVILNVHDSEPHLIILAGIAGSLKHDQVKVGDVVISDRVKSFQPDKIRQRGAREAFSDDPVTSYANSEDGSVVYVDSKKRYMSDSFFRFRRDAIVWNPSANLYQDLILESPHINFNLSSFQRAGEHATSLDSSMTQVHFGAVLGSDWVIDSPEFIDFLVERNTSRAADIYTRKYGAEDHERSRWTDDELLCVDTESYGFFRAMRDIQGETTGSQALVVRGISDLASTKEEHDKATSGAARDVAARNSVAAALAIVDRL